MDKATFEAQLAKYPTLSTPKALQTIQTTQPQQFAQTTQPQQTAPAPAQQIEDPIVVQKEPAIPAWEARAPVDTAEVGAHYVDEEEPTELVRVFLPFKMLLHDRPPCDVVFEGFNDATVYSVKRWCFLKFAVPLEACYLLQDGLALNDDLFIANLPEEPLTLVGTDWTELEKTPSLIHMVYDVIEGTCEQLVGEADACRLTHSIVQNLEEQGVLDLGQREPPSFRLHFGEMPAGFMF
eukprot:m.81830 g.81830  ORF g.81830 m.81830 type:complete len:237 (-) comp12657_c0_seq3:3147-3857(-)